MTGHGDVVTEWEFNKLTNSYLEFHHHVIEAIISATADKTTHVVFACQRSTAVTPQTCKHLSNL